MIVGITRIPTGYKPGTTLTSAVPLTPDNLFVEGRTITTAPLLFYKIASVFGGAVYEHVFASDTELDPVRLNVAVSTVNGVPDNSNRGVLVPISVKRMSSSQKYV